jgi:hydroxymethylbilane synthase
LTLRIGTRASALARAQAASVATLLGDAKIVPMTTTGDRDAAGTTVADKERWVREIDDALLRGDVDLGVHSAKDVPSDVPDGLAIVGTPVRADARDSLCGAGSLAALAPGATVGTSSLRRAAQLRAARADLDVVPMRGNVDTRLRRLGEGAYDAIVLAQAGLDRLGHATAGTPLDVDVFVPAAGQGALILMARAEDVGVRERTGAITDGPTWACLTAERAVVRALGADCRTPVGAHGRVEGDTLELAVFVGLADGSAWVADRASGPAASPDELGAMVAERVLSAGGKEILRRAQEQAPA